MRLVSNSLDGLYFRPHTDTLIALITEMKIEGTNANLKLWIRGDRTYWYRVDQCWVDSSVEALNFT